jgi:hypothetical protein
MMRVSWFSGYGTVYVNGYNIYILCHLPVEVTRKNLQKPGKLRFNTDREGLWTGHILGQSAVFRVITYWLLAGY